MTVNDTITKLQQMIASGEITGLDALEFFYCDHCPLADRSDCGKRKEFSQ